MWEIFVLLFFALFSPLSLAINQGRVVPVGFAPYMVQIRLLDKYRCGGFLTTTKTGYQYVITSASCVGDGRHGSDWVDRHKTPLPNPHLVVVAGRFMRDGYHRHEQFRRVTNKYMFPSFKWTPLLKNDDVAVLHLDRPFDLNMLVQPIPYILKNYTKAIDQTLVVPGWGHTKPDDKGWWDDPWKPSRKELRMGPVKYKDLLECRKEYREILLAHGNVKEDNRVQDEHFCAGQATDALPYHEGPCEFDDGSPALALDDGKLVVYGLYDWREPDCGHRQRSSIFWDLSSTAYWTNKEDISGEIKHRPYYT